MARTPTTRGTPADSSAAASGRDALLAAWSDERAAARSARDRGGVAGEWTHLERAHILSQPMAGAHVRTHLAMLTCALRRRRAREIVGQVMRLVVAGPGSWTGRYPVGNTGGADVSAFRPMPVPDDLRAVLESSAPATDAHGGGHERRDT
jgi:Protein of unknown function (DUF3703)